MSDLTTMLRIMGMPRCVQAADAIEALTAERDALRGLMIKFAADVLKMRTWGEPIPFRLSGPFDEEVRLLAIRISDAARKDKP